MGTIVLYTDENEEIGRTTSIREAYHLLKATKEQDKEYKITFVKYHFEYEWEDENYSYSCNVKLYKRNNKIYMRRTYEDQYQY